MIIFVRDNYKSKNRKISRGSEGLFIHHMDEDKAIKLSTPKTIFRWNTNHPDMPYKWEWQKAGRLVYCNILEHLVLHIKIMQFPHPDRLQENVGRGGIEVFILPELNDIYSGIQYQQPWKQKVVANVINFKADFFICLKIISTNFPNIDILTSYNANWPQTGWSLKNNKNLFIEVLNFLKTN